jgi:tubulin polyglutamylase TTLL2
MRAVYGSIYNFIPQTFLLPNEYPKFVQQFTKHDDRPVWICKPNDLSRGRKIFIFRDLTDLVYDTPVVVQRYIEQPLLIGQFKWDLRVYVLITSFHPLTVYIYREGLARFSTERYDLANLENKFAHLTNSSINKLSPHLYSDKKVIGSGSKWTFEQLNSYLQGSGIDIQTIWRKIEQIVILSLLPLTPQVPDISCCFELLGYDVILDQSLKPWLLEVNASPALAVECDIDVSVKSALLSDMVELLQFKPPSEYWVLPMQDDVKTQEDLRKRRYQPTFLAQKGLPVISRAKSSAPRAHRSAPVLTKRLVSHTTSIVPDLAEADLLEAIPVMREDMRTKVVEYTRKRRAQVRREPGKMPRRCGGYELIFPTDEVSPSQATLGALEKLRRSLNGTHVNQVAQQTITSILARMRDSVKRPRQDS